MPVKRTHAASATPRSTVSSWIVWSRSNNIERALSSRIMLCSQKKEATRAPRVTGLTWCRLVDG